MKWRIVNNIEQKEAILKTMYGTIQFCLNICRLDENIPNFNSGYPRLFLYRLALYFSSFPTMIFYFVIR